MEMTEWYGLVFFLLLLATYAMAWWRERGFRREYNDLEGAYFATVNELANMERDLRSTQAALDALTVGRVTDEIHPTFGPDQEEEFEP